MTMFAEVRRRFHALMQERTDNVDLQANELMQFQEALSALALKRRFTQITHIPAIQGVALYALPPNTVDVCHVLYNQRVLRYVMERSLDYHGSILSWEHTRGEPAYWTDDNQGPNVIRIIPPPLRSGSMIPVPTFLPMIYDIVDNLVVFTYEDPNLEVTNEDSVIPVLLDWEDVLVYDTVQALASQEYPEQNIPVADACKQLVDLWTKLIVKNGE